jgi:hypothetical protein
MLGMMFATCILLWDLGMMFTTYIIDIHVGAYNVEE